jgi:membrane fusion protein (multidrug efflux system)
LKSACFAEGSDIAAGTPSVPHRRAHLPGTTCPPPKPTWPAPPPASARLKPLLEIKAVSQQEYDQASARHKQAEAALARARLDLENAVPPAPISGRIGRALVTEGALVGKGEATHLATIEQLDPIRVEFSQSYSDMLRLQQAVKAGKQKADSRRHRSACCSRTVRSIPNREPALRRSRRGSRHGIRAVARRVSQSAARAAARHLRPRALPAGRSRGRDPHSAARGCVSPLGQAVMVVDAEGKVNSRTVKTGGMADQDFLIESGLKPGDQVIVNGLQKAGPAPW